MMLEPMLEPGDEYSLGMRLQPGDEAQLLESLRQGSVTNSP